VEELVADSEPPLVDSQKQGHETLALWESP